MLEGFTGTQLTWLVAGMSAWNAMFTWLVWRWSRPTPGREADPKPGEIGDEFRYAPWLALWGALLLLGPLPFAQPSAAALLAATGAGLVFVLLKVLGARRARPWPWLAGVFLAGPIAAAMGMLSAHPEFLHSSLRKLQFLGTAIGTYFLGLCLLRNWLQRTSPPKPIPS